MKTSFSHDTLAELETKLAICLRRMGWHCEKLNGEEITVSELAEKVKRSTASVSRSLHRASCPYFQAKRGRKRILTLTPNDKLLNYLTT